jgi:ribosomal protein L32
MTGLMQRIFRRRSSGPSRRGVAGLVPRLPAGLRRRRLARTGLPWGRRAEQPALTMGSGAPTTEVVETAGTASFRDRGRLRRRLRYLRRARELAFRDVGGLIFDMRRFGRDRPDLVEAKIGALAAVDQELRALERVLDDRRPIYELREPGLSSCPRCGALHASEDHFCPRCGLQIGGPQAMGEVGGAIAAPPQAPPLPVEQPAAATAVPPGAAAPADGASAPSRPSAVGGGAGPPRAPSVPPGAAPSRAPSVPPGAAPSRAPAVDGDAGPPRSRAVDADAAPDSEPTEILRPPDAP